MLAAETAISDGEEELAIDALENYVNWRGKGGFEPDIKINVTDMRISSIRGDFFHKMQIRRYEKKFGPYLDARLP